MNRSLPSLLRPVQNHTLLVVVAATCCLLAAGQGLAQRSEPLPEELEGVGITEHLDGALPLDAVFRDEDGRQIRLGDYFQADKPVVLNLGYFYCPMLCGLVSNGLLDAMSGMSWLPGREFEVVTLSFNPEETPTLAWLKKKNYLEKFDRPGAGDGWHFLTGQADQIARVTEAAGFQFKWNEEQKQFMHAAVLIICTPDGRISRYLYGIEFDPQTLRLSLVEAAKGRVGSSLDRVLLFCFRYDADEGRYAPAARNLMRAGGALTILVLGTALGLFWRRDRRRKKEIS